MRNALVARYLVFLGLLAGLAAASTAWACATDPHDPRGPNAVHLPQIRDAGPGNCTGQASWKSTETVPDKFRVTHRLQLNCATAFTVGGQPAEIDIVNCFSKIVNPATQEVVSSVDACNDSQANNIPNPLNTHYEWEFHATLHLTRPVDAYFGSLFANFCYVSPNNWRWAQCDWTDTDRFATRNYLHNIF